MKSIAFYTLGCKVNQYETARLADKFLAAGFDIAPENGYADAYIVNSCSVTAMADRKSRQYIRKMKKQNPKAFILVMGCYSQVSPSAIEEMPEADFVMGTSGKMDAFEIVCRALGEDTQLKYPLIYTPDCTRPNIKIEDGCNRFCSYCIIPFARGPVHSRKAQDIAEEAESLVKQGYKELVLTGINTALYGTEPGFEKYKGLSGIEAAIAVVNEIPGDFRIRLGSLEPTVVNAEYVKRLFKYEKLCHHFHLSLQSGSDRVLKAMNRHYSRNEYLDIVSALKEEDSFSGITTDIIAGFPGESDEDFSDSLDIIKRVDFLKVHAFPYSQRPLTRAKDMPGQLPPDIKKMRNKALIEAGELSSLAFYGRLLSSRKALRALIEEKKGKYWYGHGDNFSEIYLPSMEDLSDKYVNIIADGLYKNGLLGKEEKL